MARATARRTKQVATPPDRVLAFLRPSAQLATAVPASLLRTV